MDALIICVLCTISRFVLVQKIICIWIRYRYKIRNLIIYTIFYNSTGIDTFSIFSFRIVINVIRFNPGISSIALKLIDVPVDGIHHILGGCCGGIRYGCRCSGRCCHIIRVSGSGVGAAGGIVGHLRCR